MSTKILKRVSGLAICALLFSFTTPNFGGEGFEIFLNNKVVLQQFSKDLNTVKTLKLDQSNENDELTIKYYHCGQVGKNRTITIKDGNDNVIKQWKFKDESKLSAMNCKVKDILALPKGKIKTIKLYYSSSELPNGRQLAAIITDSKPVAKL